MVFFSDKFSKASRRDRVVVQFFWIKRTREISKLKKNKQKQKKLSNLELITILTFENYLET